MCAEPPLAHTAPISDHSKIRAVVCSHPFLVAGVDFDVEVSDCVWNARMARGVRLAGWAELGGIGRKLPKGKTAACHDDWACWWR